MTNGNDAVNSFFVHESRQTDPCIVWGLTKREYFAAMAMQGILADDAAGCTYNSATTEAARFADALIEALNK